MRITILGSGTSIPLTYMASPSILLEAEGAILLLDMGPGTIRQLARTGVNNTSIDHILLSHFHPDHTADLVHFLFVTRNPTILDKRKPFVISGSNGLKNLIKNLQQAYPKWLDMPEDKMTVEELEPLKKNIKQYNKYTVSTCQVNHTDSSIAYRIEDKKGKSIVYTGDTAWCEDLIPFTEDADLLITECSLPENLNIEGHLSPAQAGQLAASAGVKKLILVHFYPEVLSTDIAGECRKHYKGDMILGRDLLSIDI